MITQTLHSQALSQVAPVTMQPNTKASGAVLELFSYQMIFVTSLQQKTKS